MNEGGLVDNPQDLGGPTNFGISLQILSNWRKRPCTKQDMMNLLIGEAKNIYEQYFWDPLRISSLNQSIATALLDVSVNAGQHSAIKLAQQALGPIVKPDGLMGEDTLKALEYSNPKKFLIAYMAEIQERYVKIVMNTPTQVGFLDGWLKRSRRLMELI